MFNWLFAIIAVLIVAGAVYQAVAAAQDRLNYPAPGQMVSVGDRRLHLVVTGEVSEYPTVILEEGMASFSSNWYWVQEELSKMIRVVSYDQAGLGWSDPAPEAFDAYQSARDLHTALENTGIGGPYVVAGHSYGGLVVRAFTDLYPDEVVGVVLVDASHPDQWVHIKSSNDGKTVAMANKITGVLASIGIVRLFDLVAYTYAGLPEQPAGEMKAIFSQPRSWFTSSDVLAIWNERTRPQINQAHDLGDRPLVVLSVTEQALFSEELTSLQAELPSLSTNSLHYTIQGATHENMVAEQKYALIVADAISLVLETSQSGEPLSNQTFPRIEIP